LYTRFHIIIFCMVPTSHRPAPSDARYIFILFALIFVVLFFAFLIYFVYGQKQFARTNVPVEQEPVASGTIDTVRTGGELAPVNTTTPVPTPTTTPTAFDPARYNPRTVETLQLRGRQLLDKYFSSIQSADYQTACSLLSNTLCNARRDIYSFSQFLGKTSGGYTVKNISLAAEQKPTEAIYCVEYTYTLKADLNPQPVTEYFQYRIKTRPDGADEISARVCEKVIKDGRERPCPIITPKKYCF
jgi:Na+-transporting methylmalonyl-CoA/oxaloacetate decarboxylase gamma subunit